MRSVRKITKTDIWIRAVFVTVAAILYYAQDF